MTTNPSPTTNQGLFSEQAANKGKRERTRSSLLDSAISVFAQKGYELTKITDITTHAGLANGTFYNYYTDKQALMSDVAVGLAVQITGRINDEMSAIDNAAVRVATGTARMLAIAKEEPEWITVLMTSVEIVPAMHSALIRYLRQDLEMGVEQGLFSVDPDLLLINQLISLVRTALLADPELAPATVRKTCEAQLRLLGMPSKRAGAAVARALKPM